MSIFRLGILGLSFALFALAQASAAQTIMPPGVMLTSIGITHSENGRGNLLQTQLDRHDCLVGDQLTFPVRIEGNTSLSLEVWAGFGCDQLNVRVSSDSTECWKLASFAVTSSSPPPIRIAVRDLLSGRTLAGAGHSSDDPNIACQPAFESQAAQSLVVYFMLVDPSSTIQGTFASWAATYKLSGSLPPDHLSLGVGNQKLLASFSYDNPDDLSISGYQLYCEPNANSAVESDGGAPACSPPSRLSAGASTDGIQDLLCGNAGKADSAGEINGLTNNLPYNVAVAAVDSYDNVGVLSSVACAAPLATVPGEANAGSEQTSKACSFALGQPSFPLLPSIALGLCLLRRRRLSHSRDLSWEHV